MLEILVRRYVVIYNIYSDSDIGIQEYFILMAYCTPIHILIVLTGRVLILVGIKNLKNCTSLSLKHINTFTH